MYFKLALKNVKKSYKDYFVYFMTLMISVALFYLFNSFEAQQKVIVLDEGASFGFKTISVAMSVLSVLVAFVFGFLILYANNFIMKRRKKELALYTLLGMKKSRMSRIFVYETIFVGLLSLVCGISLGIIVSQGVAAFTAYILELKINYSFIFSSQAIIFTLFSFSVIFVLFALLNNIFMSRAKLIDLFKANSKSDESLFHHPIIVTVIMLLSMAMLGYLYIKVLQPLYLIQNLFMVLILGSLATYGIFFSISYWFIKFSQLLKNYYYKDLNAFSTRQISSKIKSTYKLLATVSLMLLLSFGSRASSLNIQKVLNDMFAAEGTFDFSYEISVDRSDDNDIDSLVNLKSDYEVHRTTIYSSGLNSETLGDYVINQEIEDNPFDIYGFNLDLLELSQYNYYRSLEGHEKLELKDNEIIYYLPNGLVYDRSEMNYLNDDFTLLNQDLHVKDHQNYYTNLGISGSDFRFVIVANNNTLNKMLANVVSSDEEVGIYNRHLVNINYPKGANPYIENEVVEQELRNATIKSYGISYSNKASNLDAAKESTLLITYLGLYIGLTFIVVSVMVISLQLLSEASDNFERYLLLDKIGVSEKLQKKSIFKQNLVYFGLPLLIALIHSYVGISAVTQSLVIGGLISNSYVMILVAVGLLVSIYCLYFVVTYLSSVRMIFDRKN